MKKMLWTGLVLVTPNILAFSFTSLDLFSWTFTAIIYLITISGVILYFKYCPCSFWALPVSFIISPCGLFLYERYLDSEFFPYLLTVLLEVYYAVPFALISMGIYTVLKITGQRKI